MIVNSVSPTVKEIFSRTDELVGYGLTLPDATLLANELREAGLPIPAGILTEEELRVYKRGRNAKAYTHAKNASIQEYRRATGFEAVFGYLYLKGDMERLLELAGIGLGAYCRTEKTSKNTYIPEARNRTGSGKEQE